MSSQRPPQFVDPSQRGKAGNARQGGTAGRNQNVARQPLTDKALEMLIIKGVVLFFAAVLIYIPAMNGGYIYDDDTLLWNNPAMRRGDGGWNLEAWKGLRALWFPVGDDANAAADYAPLANTTLWLEFRLWGNNGDFNQVEGNPKIKGIGAPGYHTTNIVLHGIAALLLWYLLAEIGIPCAWLAALLWAVHPVCAESVAWIAERRNPLSMILYMLTMIFWFKFRRTGKLESYWWAVGLFVLTMLAKTSIVMLPVLLLLCVWWEGGWAIRLNAGDTVKFLLLELIVGCWGLGALVSFLIGRGAGMYGGEVGAGVYMVLFTPILFIPAYQTYKRLIPMWRQVVDFQLALAVFVVWSLGLVGVLYSVSVTDNWIFFLLIFLLVPTPLAVFATKIFYDRLKPAPVWRQMLPFFYTSVIF
ncbi:MAG TPA: hypothetical protein VHI52_16410, partial [Verrucomicrobiae bacterium]|nr:hypothetical protein [Verrucomicrobiae bacterium]